MKRNDVPKDITWNLKDLYETETLFEEDLSILLKEAEKLEGLELLCMSTSDLEEFLQSYENYLIRLYKLSSFASLDLSVDRINGRLQEREARISDHTAELSARLSYITSDLHKIPEAKLQELADFSPRYKVFIKDLIRERPHRLGDETEKTLNALSGALELPFETYEMIKLADIHFDDFEVDGKKYPMNYVLYENDYCQSPDTKLRRSAYEHFYKTIGSYSYGIGSGYLSHVKTEKILSRLRGFESVTDFLLFEQEVTRDMYETHLQTMMEKLSPVMQKYAGFLKSYYGLDELYYSDLKALIDADFSPEVSLEQAKKDVEKALLPLGEEYSEIVRGALNNRWIDFAQNQGKSTGGFCASPYGCHSFILMSWTGYVSDTFTMAHEIGHAGHFQLAGEYQNFFSVNPSMYFVEAPSTCNELFLTDYLFDKESSPRNKRYVIASLLGNTYYHNYVTHFLEACFQKRVYDSLDAEKGLTTEGLHEIKKDVLKEFWKDSVIIDDKAGYTWMRQPHYYMGLYPYTYSAGLSLATNAYLALKKGELTTDDWLKTLKAGGSKSPGELASQVGVDLLKPESLERSISYVDGLVHELITLSEQIKL